MEVAFPSRLQVILSPLILLPLLRHHGYRLKSRVGDGLGMYVKVSLLPPRYLCPRGLPRGPRARWRPLLLSKVLRLPLSPERNALPLPLLVLAALRRDPPRLLPLNRLHGMPWATLPWLAWLVAQGFRSDFTSQDPGRHGLLSVQCGTSGPS